MEFTAYTNAVPLFMSHNTDSFRELLFNPFFYSLQLHIFLLLKGQLWFITEFGFSFVALTVRSISQDNIYSPKYLL